MQSIPQKMQLAGNPEGNPQFFQTLNLQNGEPISLADPKATRALVALMDMQAVLGGAASHWGGPAALAELMSVIYGYAFSVAQSKNKQWHEEFHLINDAGHCENGIYALKANYGFADLSLQSLKGFRSIESKLTGHGESHLFPEGVYLSNGPLGSFFTPSSGFMFDALQGLQRTTVTVISDGACMEGEAKEALAAIPGLAEQKKMAPFILVVSDNNTKLSGRIDEQSFSMQGSFAGLDDLGWHVLKLENPHNLQEALQVFEEAYQFVQAQPNKPVAIHARTTKGYGVKKTAESASGGHGFPLKKPTELREFLNEIYQGEPLPQEMSAWCEELEAFKSSSNSGSVEVPNEKVQLGVSQALIEKRSQGLPVISISSDLPGSTGTSSFQKEFPDSAQDVGVAEANMVSMAAGLSKQGYIPVVDTFSQFGVTKGALPLIMANLSQAPMICVFSHAGFQDAADGASHQALSYLSMTASIPHCDIYVLTSSSEAKELVGQAVERFAQDRKEGRTPRTSIFFLGRENFPRFYMGKSYEYKLGEAQVVFDNTSEKPGKVTIAAIGPLLHQALQAAMDLEEEGVGSIVVNPSSVNHPDVNTFRSCLRNTGGRLITVEDHQLIGGMGALMSHQLLMDGVHFELRSLGVKGEFGQSAYKAAQLYKKHGLDSKAIFKTAMSWD